MKRTWWIFLFLLLTSASLIMAWSNSLSQPHLIQAEEISHSVNVFAAIGGNNYFTLFGYSSPGALVKLEGIGIYDQTFADKKGYFEFHDAFSPFSPRETCLSGQDQLGRISMAVCLAPFQTNKNMTIGPVILPPTLSLNKGTFFVSDDAIVSGQSLPNSTLDLFTFVNNQTNTLVRDFNIIRPVEALDIPKIEIHTDALGNFSVALPSSRDTNIRLFAQTLYGQSPSPKSNTLELSILPVWMIILNLIKLFLNSLQARLMEIILLTELIFLVLYLLRVWIFDHIILSKKALLIPVESGLTIEPEIELTIYHKPQEDLLAIN